MRPYFEQKLLMIDKAHTKAPFNLNGFSRTLYLRTLQCAVVLVPLVFFANSFDPVLIKESLVHVFAAMLLGIRLVDIASSNTMRLSRGRILFILCAMAFALSGAISYFAISKAPDVSFEDFWLRLSYMMLAIAVVTDPDISGTIIAVRRILPPVAAFICICCIAQHAGFDPLNRGAGQVDRPGSCLGNANLVAVCLLIAMAFVLPLSAGRSSRRAFFECGLAALAGLIYGCIVVVAHVPQSLLARLLIPALLLFVLIALAFWRGVRGLNLAEGPFWFLCFFCLVLTQSRAAFIGCALIMLIFGFTQFRRLPHKKSRMALVVGFIAIAAIVGAGVWHFTRERALSTKERTYTLRGAVDLIRQKPILGHGIGTFKINFPLVKKREAWAYQEVCFTYVRNVYNEYLEMAHDEGIPGLLLFLALPGIAFGGYWTWRKRCKRSSEGRPRAPVELEGMEVLSAVAAMSAILVVNGASLSLRYAFTGFFFWFLLAATAAAAFPAPINIREQRMATIAQRKGLIRVGIPVAAAAAIVVVAYHACRYCMADLLLAQGQRHSLAAYQQAPTIKGDVYHDIYTEGATYLSDPAEWDTAIVAFNRSLALNPHDLFCRYFLANAFNRRWLMNPAYQPSWGDAGDIAQTDPQRALKNYLLVIDQAPHFMEVDWELGNLFSNMGKPEQAIAWYREYITYRPFFTKAHFLLARALTKAGKPREAVEAYKDALDLNDKFTLAWVELAQVYRSLGDTVLEAESMRRAQESSSRGAPRIAMETFAQAQSWKSAAAYADSSIRIDSTDADLYFRKGFYLSHIDSIKPAIDAYRKALALKPDHVTALVNLSNLLFAVGDTAGSIDAYKKAHALDPQGAERMMKAAN